MDFSYSETQDQIREAVGKLCADFDPAYWRGCDETGAYPEAFVAAMTEAGWLGALIPEEYGGSGLTLMDACVILEEINRSGGNGAACHAQMYTMASVLRHGSAEQKQKYLPRIAAGTLRLQAFGCDRARCRIEYATHQDVRTQDRWRLRDQRPENLDLALPSIAYVSADRADNAL